MIAIPRLVNLHEHVGAPHSQDCHEFEFLCRWHVRLVTEHEEKSVHGRAASVGRLLTEAKDYSRLKCNVNGYF